MRMIGEGAEVRLAIEGSDHKIWSEYSRQEQIVVYAGE